ncbi:rhomboid family intramembrane serine protease [Pseudoneobacillus rhizosphaerae]|uniref:Rhomboid protease GlpG n=1 Tax=Pseudoneobacillus rhizosphaerae TaxID=2880968 RepID=A0A9C7LCY5_9BACI|nr:rhomboid family intramembrane serine protease [Pseudoneobacillus rhizosphaerae]CAG9610305.1 Rhomboid protease GlpG [Pseudoneobacillus rhizosphaerae]
MFTRTESFKEFLRFYPIVSVIIFINLLVFVIGYIPFLPRTWIYETFSGVNLYVAHGEFWRLLTPIFLHSGFTHLLFNSFSLVLFGPALERIAGKGRFLTIYLVSGIAANIATFLIQPLTYIHVGSSGAIFGLFGYYLAIISFRKSMLSRENAQLVKTIAILSIIMTFLQPNINVTAHIFGLISGYLIGAILLKK